MSAASSDLPRSTSRATSALSGMSFEASSPQQDQSKECSPVCERCGSGSAAPSLPEVARRLDPRKKKGGAPAPFEERRQPRTPASNPAAILHGEVTGDRAAGERDTVAEQ